MEDKDKRVLSNYQILILQTLLDQNYSDYDQNKEYTLQNLSLDQIINHLNGNQQRDRNIFDDGSNEVSSLI